MIIIITDSPNIDLADHFFFDIFAAFAIGAAEMQDNTRE